MLIRILGVGLAPLIKPCCNRCPPYSSGGRRVQMLAQGQSMLGASSQDQDVKRAPRSQRPACAKARWWEGQTRDRTSDVLCFREDTLTFSSASKRPVFSKMSLDPQQEGSVGLGRDKGTGSLSAHTQARASPRVRQGWAATPRAQGLGQPRGRPRTAAGGAGRRAPGVASPPA